MLKPEGGTELRLKSKYIAERFFEGCSLLIIHVSAGLLVVTLSYHITVCISECAELCLCHRVVNVT